MVRTPSVQLDRVSVWKNGQSYLEDISWTIHSGEHWALLGANGAGKTTLLQVMTGYLWPTRGQVHILGETLGQVDVRELRKRIGWVSPSLSEWLLTHHAQDTALDVVAAGLQGSIGRVQTISSELKEQALTALQLFQGQTLAARSIKDLSQGEKQRLLLTRAWIAQPQLLILDEPCTGLDLPGREQFLESLDTLMTMPNSPTVIYVTHYIEELRPAVSHACIVKAGKIY
ncbi:MAG: ATP-binding cassette domain-containing protein, partial [Firmicutes bacterium]|nr:ATP-binding cassette domain-containing protein [Bacillota bacterium]